LGKPREPAPARHPHPLPAKFSPPGHSPGLLPNAPSPQSSNSTRCRRDQESCETRPPPRGPLPPPGKLLPAHIPDTCRRDSARTQSAPIRIESGRHRNRSPESSAPWRNHFYPKPLALESPSTKAPASAYSAENVSPNPGREIQLSPCRPPGQMPARPRSPRLRSPAPDSKPPPLPAALPPNRRRPRPAAPQSAARSLLLLCYPRAAPIQPPVWSAHALCPDAPHRLRYRIRAPLPDSRTPTAPPATAAAPPSPPRPRARKPAHRGHRASQNHPASAPAPLGQSAAPRRIVARQPQSSPDSRPNPRHPAPSAPPASSSPWLFRIVLEPQAHCLNRRKPPPRADSSQSPLRKSAPLSPTLRSHSSSNRR